MGRKSVYICLEMLCLLLALSGCRVVEDSPQREETSWEKLVMQWPAEGRAPTGLSRVQEAVSRITREKLGVEIELYPLGGEAMKTALTVASGRQLDLCVNFYRSLEYLVNGGYIQSLEKLSGTHGQDIRRLCGDRLAGGNYRRQLYGIPVLYSRGYRTIFLARQDILDKYGITVEKDRKYSLDELEGIFRTVKEGEGADFVIVGGNAGAALGAGAPYDVLGASLASGCLLLEDGEERIVNLYGTGAYEDYARRMYRWNRQGFFPENAALESISYEDAIREGNMLGAFMDDATEQENRCRALCGYEMSAIVVEEACLRTSTYQSVLWCITSTCKNPEKAMAFMNLLYTDTELANLLQYGLEGESYVVKEQDDYGSVIDWPQGMNPSNSPYYMAYGIYGNRLKTHVWAPGTTRQNYLVEQFGNAITNKSPALGYVFDSGELEARVAAVKEVIQKYSALIAYGLVDPEAELALFREELKRAGIDAVIEENQRQYDAWKVKRE